jgi:hypothetical protein
MFKKYGTKNIHKKEEKNSPRKKFPLKIKEKNMVKLVTVWIYAYAVGHLRASTFVICFRYVNTRIIMKEYKFGLKISI